MDLEGVLFRALREQFSENPVSLSSIPPELKTPEVEKAISYMCATPSELVILSTYDM